MARKDKLPWAVKQQCRDIVKSYDLMRARYRNLRREILDAGGDNSITYTVNGEERRAYMPSQHNATRTAEDIAMKLDGLEQTLLARQIRAVDHAKAKVGRDLPEALQDALREAIMTNCDSGRKYPFERLFITGISRRDFYYRRDDFFRDIAEELGLWV